MARPSANGLAMVERREDGHYGLEMLSPPRVGASYAAARGAMLLARFTEVGSGRCANRCEPAKALHLAKVTGAVLVTGGVSV